MCTGSFFFNDAMSKRRWLVSPPPISSLETGTALERYGITWKLAEFGDISFFKFYFSSFCHHIANSPLLLSESSSAFDIVHRAILVHRLEHCFVVYRVWFKPVLVISYTPLSICLTLDLKVYFNILSFAVHHMCLGCTLQVDVYFIELNWSVKTADYHLPITTTSTDL